MANEDGTPSMQSGGGADEDFSVRLGTLVSAAVAIVLAPLLILVSCANPAAAGGGSVGDPVWRVLDRLVAGDRDEGDELGTSVAVSGDTIVVGAPGIDGSARDTGAAYVFVRSASGVWTEDQKLTAVTQQNGAAFGSAVAVSGDAAVVGAPKEDRGAFADAGLAYVFERDGAGHWGAPQPLTGDHDTPGGDLFGTGVSISGSTLVIGTSGDDDSGLNAGAAYVSMRGATVWSPPEKITASDGATGDQFGSSVGVSGERVIIGAPFGNASFDVADSGAAYLFVFDSDSGTYVEDQKLIASDAAFQDAFGASVGISGTTAIVAASENDLSSTNEGAAYVFALDADGIWSEVAALTAVDGTFQDLFGTAVSLDGTTGVVGAPGVDAGAGNSGAAYPVRFE